MLNEQGISKRRGAYPCCAMSYMHSAIIAWDRGEQGCGEENYEKAVYMLWASRVMCDAPIGGDAHPGCTSVQEASEWASHADCLCVPCGCPEAPPPDCAIVPDLTVLEARAQADLPPDAEDGDAYYLLSGANAGQIATWQTDEWVFSSVLNDSIVWATVTNDYWTNLGAGPGPLFPAPLLVLQIPGWWLMTQLEPQTAGSRTVTLQGLGPNGWYDLTPPFPEANFPQILNLTGLQFTATRFLYETQDGCEYISGDGSFEPPVVPPADCTIIPDFTVDQLVDANQQGLLQEGRYWIISNQFSVTNEWSQNVDSIVDTSLPTETFTAVPVGNIVYDLSTQVYWWLTANGPSPLFPPLTITMGIGSYTVQSDYPAQSAIGTRSILVFDAAQTVLWSGQEFQLPQTVSSAYQPVAPITVRYFNTADCYYDVDGAIDTDSPIQVEFDCDAIQYFTYRYTDEPYYQQSFLFLAPPGQVVRLQFYQGQMDSVTVIRAFDGVDSNGTPIPGLTGNFTDFSSALPSGEAYSGSLYLEVDAPIDMPADLTTWLFGVSCLPTGIAPSGFVTSQDKCDEYAFSLTLEVTFMGDSTEISIQYSVDGETPVVIPGITSEGIYPIGSFPIGSEVTVILLHESDPLANQMIGVFSSNGSCPIIFDLCAPEGASKIDAAGPCDEIPVPGPFNGYAYLINAGSCPGLPQGEIFSWNSITQQYDPFSANPGVYYIQSPPQFWVTQGPGIQPYPILPQGELSPSGQSPLNYLLHLPQIAIFNIPTNRPVALEVRLGIGPWQQVWTGTEQQLILPYPIQINVPFNGARIVFNYLDCGMTSGVIINDEP